MPKPQPSSKPSKKIAPAPPVQPPKPPSKRDMKTISFADILKAKGVPEDVLKPRDIGPMILDAVKDGHAKVLITGLGTFYVGEVKGRTIVTPVGTPDGVPREIQTSDAKVLRFRSAKVFSDILNDRPLETGAGKHAKNDARKAAIGQKPAKRAPAPVEADEDEAPAPPPKKVPKAAVAGAKAPAANKPVPKAAAAPVKAPAPKAAAPAAPKGKPATSAKVPPPPARRK